MTGPHAFTRFLLDAGWNLDAPQFVEQDQFFRHRFDIAAAQTDKSQFLDEAMKDPGTAPLLNLWTNSWVEPAVKTTLKKLPVVGAWVSDPFSASLKYILSE
jgi:hypothetical protein